jgi:hypothetical protein
MLGWVIGLCVLGMLAYVRFSPADAARFHVEIDAAQDENRPGGAVRVRPGSPAMFAQVAAYLEALPRTRRIAGTPEAGHVTYQTRSLWLGFPDYTTAQYTNGEIRLFARLRFGNSDVGVNARRLDRLLQVVQP